MIGQEFDSNFIRIPLTPEIYGASRRDLADLRLLSVDSKGVSTQIPYILVSPTDETGQADKSLPITDRREVSGNSEFVLDARLVTDPVEKLQLLVASSERNYARRVRLYGADQPNDGDWKLLVNDGFLLDRVRDAQRLTESTIACPRSQFRYYRAVIENEGEAPLSITGGQAHMVRRHAAPRVSYTLQVANEVHLNQKITRVELTLLGPVPVDRLELTVSGADEYHRNAQLMAISDTTTSIITSVALFHLAQFSKGPTTSVSIRPQSSARFRLEIANGDDQPLTVSAAQAFGIEQSLAVPVKSMTANPNPIAIYVGGDIDSPSYDLARISTLPDVEKMSTLGVLPGEKNAAYHEVTPQRPWAEDHQTLVWVAVLGGVVVLSAAAIKLLQAASAPEQAATAQPAPPTDTPPVE